MSVFLVVRVHSLEDVQTVRAFLSEKKALAECDRLIQYLIQYYPGRKYAVEELDLDTEE
jgi:hypothetical protein